MKNVIKTMLITKISLVLLLFLPAISSATQVGDAGVSFDLSKLDPDYPQMSHWIQAGVRGGIPLVDQVPIRATLNSGADSNAINNAINAAVNAGGGAVYLQNGTYDIDDEVKMKTSVSLIGESRSGVQCIINPNMTDNSGAFEFLSGVNNAGIYRLTIKGGWGTPFYDWNYGINANNELPGNENISVWFHNAFDCWIDDCDIINSADFPVRISSDHITVRNCRIDGVFNKHGGAHGYFFILEGYNLVTACEITRLRHISLQGDGVRYNVVYDNDFMQEVSFHSGDDGDNLIENNRIHIPADMPNGGNEPDYFSIMGPWSTRHDISTRPNYIYRNDVIEHNHGGATPWSDPNTVYYGPHFVRPANPLINFTPYAAGVPSGGTLYPIILGPIVDVEGCTVSPDTLIIEEGESIQIAVEIAPVNASNQSVTWSSEDSSIASVDSLGNVTGVTRGQTTISATTIDGGFTSECLITTIPSMETIVQLSPIDDAYLQNGSRHNNQIIRVEKGNRVGYFKFNLAELEGTITAATLSLTVSTDSGNGKIIIEQGDTTQWEESNLTSNNAPSAVSEISSLTGSYDSGQKYTWDLSVDALETGDQLSLILSHLSGNDVSFVSKEGATQNTPLLSLTIPASALDQWLSQHQLFDPLADEDMDGQDNYNEFKFGTDPRSPASQPHTMTDTEDSDIKLSFHSALGQTYTLQHKANLEDKWTDKILGISGTGEWIERTLPIGDDKEFFRVVAD